MSSATFVVDVWTLKTLRGLYFMDMLIRSKDLPKNTTKHWWLHGTLQRCIKSNQKRDKKCASKHRMSSERELSIDSDQCALHYSVSEVIERKPKALIQTLISEWKSRVRSSKRCCWSFNRVRLQMSVELTQDPRHDDLDKLKISRNVQSSTRSDRMSLGVRLCCEAWNGTAQNYALARPQIPQLAQQKWTEVDRERIKTSHVNKNAIQCASIAPA